MRILIAAPLIATAVLALAACTPAEEPVATAPEGEIQSTTAPSMGGPAALPTDGGVTPAPEAVEDATATDMAAPASPERAAELSGGAQPNPAETPTDGPR